MSCYIKQYLVYCQKNENLVMKKTNKILSFRLGDETHPVILSAEKEKNNYMHSIFSSQISKAVELINGIVNGTSNPYNHNYEFGNDQIKICNNNIISLIGDRGSGKSSCLYSIRKVIESSSGIENEELSQKLMFMEVIDPSFFDPHHNILDLFIGALFANYKEQADEYLKSEQRYDYTNPYYVLNNAFVGLKRSLIAIESRSKFSNDNEVEELENLAAGSKLRLDFYDLIQKVLEINKRKYLVISIDDVDLNTSQAYEMVEQIRKYLSLPNVILLIAVKFDQLKKVIMQDLSKQYDSIMRHKAVSIKHISEMADRYLAKLMPLAQRIFMPHNTTFLNTEIEIYRKEERIKERTKINELVVDMIENHCGYKFYNDKSKSSLIIPRNLRNLFNLITLLFEMQDPNGDDKEEIQSHNREVFNNYFFSEWITCLSFEDLEIAEKLISIKEPALLNMVVIESLVSRLGEDVINYNKIRDLLNVTQDNSSSSNFNYYNVSIGDVQKIMSAVIRYDTELASSNLLFFIETLYTIRMYQYKSNIENFLSLIGGSYWTLSGDDLISLNKKDDCRELSFIDGKLLNNEIKKLLPKDNTNNDNTTEVNLLNKEEITKLRSIEFIILCSTYYFYTKSGKPEKAFAKEENKHSYRERYEIYYERNLESVSYIRFDVLAPFFNMIDLERTYSRFSKGLFTLANENKGSLLHSIKSNKIVLYNFEEIKRVFIKLSNTKKDRSGSFHEQLYRLYSKIKTLFKEDFGQSFNELSQCFNELSKCVREAHENIIKFLPLIMEEEYVSEEFSLDNIIKANKSAIKAALMNEFGDEFDSEVEKAFNEVFRTKNSKPYVISSIENKLKEFAELVPNEAIKTRIGEALNK